MTPDGEVTPEALLWLAVDVLGSLALLAAAALAIGVSRARAWPGRAFWLGAGFGMAYLAGDERFSLHERMGRRLYAAGVPNPPGMNHMDDAVLLVIALAGLVFSALFVREIVASRPFAALFALAGVVTGLGLAVDARAPVDGWAPRVEEVLELGGQALFLGAFAVRFADVARVAWSPLEWNRRGRPVGTGTSLQEP